MILDENPHLFSYHEIDQVPRHEIGVFMLWRGTECVGVIEGNLHTRLLTAKKRIPAPTHFSLVKNSHGAHRFQLAERLRILHGLRKQCFRR